MSLQRSLDFILKVMGAMAGFMQGEWLICFKQRLQTVGFQLDLVSGYVFSDS